MEIDDIHDNDETFEEEDEPVEMDITSVETAKKEFQQLKDIRSQLLELQAYLKLSENNAQPKPTQDKRKGRAPKKHRTQDTRGTELIVDALKKKKATAEQLKEKSTKPLGRILVEDAQHFQQFTAQNSLWKSCTADRKLDLVGDKEVLVDQMLNVDQYIIETKLKSLNPDPYKEIKKLKTEKLLKEAISTKDSALSKELSQAPEHLRSALSDPSSTQYKQYFLPLGCSISKPFISDQRIQYILKSPELRLCHGDVIHVPFSSEEELIVQHQFNSGPRALQEIIESLYELLPGRTLNDISRYIKGKVYNILKDQTFTETRVITYQQLPRAGATSQLLFARQHSTRKSDLEKQIWKQYKVTGKHLTGPRVSTCKFHPNDYKVVAVTYSDTESNIFPESVIYDLNKQSVIDLKEGEEKPHKDCIPDAFFSHSGDYVLTACFDSLIRVFSSTNGQLIHSFGKKTDDRPGHKEKITVMCQPPTGVTDIVASVSEDRIACVWNFETGTCLQSLNGKGRNPWRGGAVTFQFGKGLLENSLIATTDCDPKKSGEIWIWDYDNDKVSRIVNDKLFAGDVYASEISKSGTEIYIGAASVVALYDWRTLNEQRVTYTPQKDINQLILSPCERFIACGGVDNRTFVYDTRYCAKPLHILSHEDDPAMKDEDIQGVTSVRWTRAGYLVTGGDDGVVRIWDTRAGSTAIHAMKGHHASINYIDISTNEDYIISGADDNFAALYGISDKYNLYRDINKPDS